MAPRAPPMRPPNPAPPILPQTFIRISADLSSTRGLVDLRPKKKPPARPAAFRTRTQTIRSVALLVPTAAIAVAATSGRRGRCPDDGATRRPDSPAEQGATPCSGRRGTDRRADTATEERAPRRAVLRRVTARQAKRDTSDDQPILHCKVPLSRPLECHFVVTSWHRRVHREWLSLD